MKYFLGAFLVSIIVLASTTARSAEGTVSFEVMKPQTALNAAQAALEHCRGMGFQVGVAVVDRFGGVQVALRDQLAGARTINTAIGKARTAVGFRTNTSDMVPVTAAGQPAAGIRNLPGVIVVGGGVMIEAAGSLVGGIGVSGAPGGDMDDICAFAGIEAIEDLLEF
ncbi:MAG: heme-binding protein [Acidiferrobacteraceae bacterium]|nr:heme-binding protein [Acidiferrobacteraceae bacterium]